jgi:hypothetical protein
VQQVKTYETLFSVKNDKLAHVLCGYGKKYIYIFSASDFGCVKDQKKQ